MALNGVHRFGEVAPFCRAHGHRAALERGQEARLGAADAMENQRIAEADLDHALAQVKDGHSRSESHGTTVAGWRRVGGISTGATHGVRARGRRRRAVRAVRGAGGAGVETAKGRAT